MTIGHKIGQLRRQAGMTQEALAQRLGVTNQAVSKWESDQSCPDIALLPALADLFGVSIDTLFDRSTAAPEAEQSAGTGDKRSEDPRTQQEDTGKRTPKFEIRINGTEFFSTSFPWEKLNTPWEDDDTIRIGVFRGKKHMTHYTGAEDLVFRLEGPAADVHCELNLTCAEVAGDVNAGGNVTCGNVGGDVDAGDSVFCGDVDGDVDAGNCVTCSSVCGDVDAGSSVTCGNVGGDVDAGSSVTCGNVGGDVDAGGNAEIQGTVEGNVDAGGNASFR